MRSCLFINGDTSGLYLDDIIRDNNNRIVEAWVINGQWTLLLKYDEVLCMDGDYVVTRRPYKSAIEIKVPDSWSGDYNEILDRARKEL